MNSPIPEKIGRFEITKVLGQGGMGVVYLGRDSGTEREVAIKTVRADAPEDIKQRLRVEGKAGKLDHENIVTVYETGQWNGDVPYIAMQFVPGDSLDKIVGSRIAWTLLEKLDTIRQICDGLDYAHLNGVVHRDIKPANIIRRSDGLVKIVDFGIARVQTSRATTAMTGPLQVIGTLAYMAPERLRGERGDGRVDIFATGVLLYYVLTGEEPFTGEASSVMHKLVSEPHPPLSQRLANYPTALDQILDRALAKYPEDRYSTAQEFAADLAAVVDELNRGRIAGLLEECKRLIDEGAFRVAAERAQLILRIDPQNAAARELRRNAQRGLDRKAIEERLQELQAEAAEAVAQKRYDDAIRALEEASRRAPADTDIQDQLEGIREKRRLQLLKDTLYSEARSAQSSGDLTGAIQRLRKAVEFDPDDVPLLEELSALERVAREQEERDRANRLIANANKEIGAQRFTEAVTILEDLLQTRVSHPELDGLYRKALDGRKNQDTERRRDHIITQVRKLRIDGKYSDALSEINHVPDELRSDTMLLRLKRELERDAENSRLAAWIAESVDLVVKEALVSLDTALTTLRVAMQKLPGEDRFESLEADLLRRKLEFSNQQRRAACLREAGEALHANEPERAIKLIEYYLLEFKTDAEIDGLLQEARLTLEAQRLRGRLADYTAQGRALLDSGKFTQAISYLQPLVEETQNRGLATLLTQAEQGKSEADSRVRLIAKRVAELRQEGKLAEAIALIESQPPGMAQNSLLQEVLPRLREEEKQRQQEQKRHEEKQREEATRRQALEAAMAKMRLHIEKGEWQNAREPLENLQRVYGESDALTRTLAELDRERSAAANAAVSRSIEEAKAALVADDRQGAQKALTQSAVLVAFASAPLTAEWKRLERLPAAKVAKPPTPVAAETSAPQESTTEKSKMPLVLAAAAAVILVVAGILFFTRSGKPSSTASPTDSHVAEVKEPTNPASSTRIPADTGSGNLTAGAPVAGTPGTSTPGVGAPGGSTPGVTTPPVVNMGTKGLAAKVPGVLEKPPAGNPSATGGANPPSQPPLPAAQPVVLVFKADRPSIMKGETATLQWNVSNAASVEISPGIPKQLPQSSYPVNPTARTTYQLYVNGKAEGNPVVVDVTTPVPVVTTAANTPPSITSPPPSVPQPRPDAAALTSALRAFQRGVFERASTGNTKDCKSALAALKDIGSGTASTQLQPWCESAPKFRADVSCAGTPEGSDKDATWRCSETITIVPKDGPSSSPKYQGEAHLTKSQDGTWKILSWPLR